MQRFILLLSLLLGLGLCACRASTSAPPAADEVAARPEVRYYMIADT